MEKSVTNEIAINLKNSLHFYLYFHYKMETERTFECLPLNFLSDSFNM